MHEDALTSTALVFEGEIIVDFVMVPSYETILEFVMVPSYETILEFVICNIELGPRWMDPIIDFL